MITAENEKYLIIDTENKFYLNPIFIFIKKNGEVLRTDKNDIETFIYCPINKIEKELGELCIKKGII